MTQRRKRIGARPGSRRPLTHDARSATCRAAALAFDGWRSFSGSDRDRALRRRVDEHPVPQRDREPYAHVSLVSHVSTCDFRGVARASLTNRDRDSSLRLECVDRIVSGAGSGAGCCADETDVEGSARRGTRANSWRHTRSCRCGKPRRCRYCQHGRGLRDAIKREHPRRQDLDPTVGVERARSQRHIGDGQRRGITRTRRAFTLHDVERCFARHQREPSCVGWSRGERRRRHEPPREERFLRLVAGKAARHDLIAGQDQFPRMRTDRE